MPLPSIHYLLDRLMKGALTEQEQQQLTEMLQKPDHEELVKEELLRMLQSDPTPGSPVGDPFTALSPGNPAFPASPADNTASPQPATGLSGDGDWSRVLRSVLSIDKTAGLLPHSASNTAPKKEGILLHLRRSIRKWSVAAILLLTFTAGAFWLLHKKQPKPLATHTTAPPPAAILPGSNQAILTLANGSQVTLNDAQKGVLGRQGNTRIIKLDNGKLAYDAGHGEIAGQQASLYNTIATPRGGQYQVTLPDGTKVWLNAASSLRFPTAFSGNTREVQLNGEAYFEVTPDKTKPFLVQAGSTRTLVIGTHFNIMAYDDEAAIRTTLLEGAVRMDKGTQSTVLQPGQQGDLEIIGDKLTTKTVNTKAVIAWKDGYYYFDRTPVQSVMRQIARWYNVDIEYRGPIPHDEIVGKIPRTAYVADVLHIMELIGIHFSIEGRKIIVLDT